MFDFTKQQCQLIRVQIRKALIFCFFISQSITIARAQISYTDLEFAETYYQGGTSSQPVPLIVGTVLTANPNDATTVSLTTPTGASVNLPLQSPGQWYGTGNQGAINGIYPNGTYTFETSGGTIGNAEVAIQANKSFPTEELFTGNSLANLQMDSVSAPISITFDPFVPDPNAFQSNLTLILLGPSNNVLYSNLNLDPSTSGFTFPANTFAPDTSYTLHIQTYNFYLPMPQYFPEGGGVGYATNNFLQFTTASVPEPSESIYVLITLVAAVLMRRSAKRV